jgi:hypothetical protein
LTIPAGQTSVTFNIPIINDNLDENDETVNLTLNSPVNAFLGTPNIATLTIIDDDLRPTVHFASSGYTGNEASGTAVLTASLTGLSSFPITVDFTTSDGTATAGADYLAKLGTITFPPGSSSESFTISILDDLIDEPNETVEVTLIPPINNATFGTPIATTLTIIDDEPTPTVQFDSLTYSVLENQGTATITATLSGLSALTVSANYSSSNITAIAGSDYLTATGTLTFPPGQQTQTFTVSIIDDVLVEPDEELRLSLGSPLNANIGVTNPAILTIVEDSQPNVEFDRPTYQVNEGGGSATITVTLDIPSLFTVTVNYSTSDISTSAGLDYTATSGTLTFLPGQTITTFNVAILQDQITNEINEQLLLTLSGSSNAIVGATNPATLTIIDDDPLPTVRFVTSEYSVYESDDSGTGVAKIAIGVSLSAQSALPVTVTYSDTLKGTATPVSDYNAPITNTLTFAPGQVGQSFNVNVVNDVVTDAVTETIKLTLINPTNAALGLANTTLTIVDNEPTQPACTGSALIPGEPNEGPPNKVSTRLACNTALVVTLTKAISTSGTTAYDLVYYEIDSEAPPSPGNIYLDQIIVQVGTSLSGPWFTVFNWGDGIRDNNTNVGASASGLPETDNKIVPFTVLYANPAAPTIQTGIAIDVDARAPAGIYPYVRFFSPFSGDGPDVDAVHAF